MNGSSHIGTSESIVGSSEEASKNGVVLSSHFGSIFPKAYFQRGNRLLTHPPTSEWLILSRKYGIVFCLVNFIKK